MSQESSNLSSVDLQVSDDTDVTKTQVNGVANKHVSVEISKEADPEDNESDDVSSDVDLTEEEAVAHQRLCKGLSLSIAYAANTGGIATLTGTPPNLVFSGQADLYFKKYGGESGVTFLRWMIMAFPLSLMMLILCWLWLTAIFLRGFAEIETLICFILLTAFESLDPWLINLVICVAVAMATEITSNTATATLLMPIMAELSLRLNVNPLYFMSSAALATSFAFMMPVATPPNAIVFSHGHLKISDMPIWVISKTAPVNEEKVSTRI
nr:hypothetical protein BaRGS_020496 [Batillaria attramentaria]